MVSGGYEGGYLNGYCFLLLKPQSKVMITWLLRKKDNRAIIAQDIAQRIQAAIIVMEERTKGDQVPFSFNLTFFQMAVPRDEKKTILKGSLF